MVITDVTQKRSHLTQKRREEEGARGREGGIERWRSRETEGGMERCMDDKREEGEIGSLSVSWLILTDRLVERLASSSVLAHLLLLVS